MLQIMPVESNKELTITYKSKQKITDKFTMLVHEPTDINNNTLPNIFTILTTISKTALDVLAILIKNQSITSPFTFMDPENQNTFSKRNYSRGLNELYEEGLIIRYSRQSRINNEQYAKFILNPSYFPVRKEIDEQRLILWNENKSIKYILRSLYK